MFASRLWSTLAAAVVLLASNSLSPSLASSLAQSGTETSSGMTLRASLDLGQLTDMAFWGSRAVVARKAADPRFDGFSILDLSNPSRPREVGRFVCPGSHADISIWEDLVFLSVDGMAGGWSGPECDADPATGATQDPFAGIRVVSIEDPRKPVQVAAVRTNCGNGSHTHTLLPDPLASPTRLVLYSNYACETVVEVPLDSPAATRVVREFPQFACHDTTIFAARKLGACGAPGGTILWDLTDPTNPVVLSIISDGASVPPSTHHSSAFSWDGRTIAIADEINSGNPECHANSPDPQGRIWFHDITNPRVPVPRGSYQLPHRATAGRYCSAHYFTVVPLEGERDILTSAWFGEGVTVIDFTDPTQPPRELAHFTAEPSHPTDHAFAYVGYWYNGFLYATNSRVALYGETSTTRSLDVFELDAGVLPAWLCTTELNAQTQVTPSPAPPGTCRAPSSPDPASGGCTKPVGTRRADVLHGSAAPDRICGLAGADVLRGRLGSDVLLGGGGPDVLRGGRGSDVCIGGRGRDRRHRCETRSISA